MNDAPKIPPQDYDESLPQGGSNEPLPLLPDREWLKAKIVEVKYQYSMFKGQIQYLKDMDEVEILDKDGQKIPRREFEFVFEFPGYNLPNGKPRKQWLRLSASLGEKAHLPVFLDNMGVDPTITTPREIIEALKDQSVYLQLKNKPNKDKSKLPYQQVLFDAVKPFGQGKPKAIEQATSIDADDLPDLDPSDDL